MSNYDFQNLSFIEFESIVQDLLQKQLSLRLECFTEGKDGGIDLRHSKNIDNDIIVQCKKYKNFSSLFCNLKKEAVKVKKIKPLRYILATSVGLTPLQKNKIVNIFKPFITKNEDILGRNDLNNLLGIYDDIEKKHLKLYLPSVGVLKKILHSKVYNQSQFEKDKIEETIKVYVENQSFNEAVEIINRNKFVIISGIPGIGKTTLARMLSYYFLANNFDEFVFLSDDIDSGYESYLENKKQIFLFDDFLGRNFLESKLLKNEERKIIDFIIRISKSNNKILILTTREYILNQAKNYFEDFDTFDWKNTKCILDLSKYTRKIRAKILYNHIYFSNLPSMYIDNILKNKNYIKIIDHRNYNPRIIENIIEKGGWKNIENSQFYDYFKKCLDYPETIWKHTFDNQIYEMSRILLMIIATTGSPVFISDIKLAIQNFIKVNKENYSIPYTESNFKKCLKELENTFIITNVDARGNHRIEFQNPSIYDFLIKYIQENSDIFTDLIKSFIFFNQFTIFSIKESAGKIKLNNNIFDLYLEKIVSNFEKLDRSTLIRVVDSSNEKNNYWEKRNNRNLYKIDEILKEFEYEKIKDFIKDKINNYDFKNISSEEQQHFINILKKVKNTEELKIDEIISGIFDNLTFVDDVINFIELKKIKPTEFIIFWEKININKIKSIITEEIQYTGEEDKEYLLSRIEEIQSNVDLPIGSIVDSLKEDIEENRIAKEEKWKEIDPSDLPSYYEDSDNDEDEITDIFESLKEKNNQI